MRVTDGLGIRRSSARFDPTRDGPRGKPAGRHSWRLSACQMELFKKNNENNALQGNLDHICVLFVQHLLEKGLSHAFGSGSFVACAEVLGNCDLATEGGIPRSSR